MAKNTETEIKLYIPDLKAVAKRLEDAGAELTKPRVYERNWRYDDDEQGLSQHGLVLRLREDSRVRLTYKEDDGETSDDGSKSRYEAEVTVSDFETMDTILNKLGFTAYMIYEKYRTTYELDDAEIVLDELPYGNFVEIEGDTAAIKRLLKTLALEEAKPYPAGYSSLFDFVRLNLELDIRDLTFANFEGLSVPQSAFEPPE